MAGLATLYCPLLYRLKCSELRHLKKEKCWFPESFSNRILLLQRVASPRCAWDSDHSQSISPGPLLDLKLGYYVVNIIGVEVSEACWNRTPFFPSPFLTLILNHLNILMQMTVSWKWGSSLLFSLFV